jgi:hypothetical protein
MKIVLHFSRFAVWLVIVIVIGILQATKADHDRDICGDGYFRNSTSGS